MWLGVGLLFTFACLNSDAPEFSLSADEVLPGLPMILGFWTPALMLAVAPLTLAAIAALTAGFSFTRVGPRPG